MEVTPQSAFITISLVNPPGAQYPLPQNSGGPSWRGCLTTHYPVGQYGVMDHRPCFLPKQYVRKAAICHWFSWSNHDLNLPVFGSEFRLLSMQVVKEHFRIYKVCSAGCEPYRSVRLELVAQC